MKHELIEAILDLSGDEFENEQEKLDLYKESNQSLVERLIHIANWYRNSYNEI